MSALSPQARAAIAALRGCDAAATARYEVYTSYGSLAYTLRWCDAHMTPAVEGLRHAGLTLRLSAPPTGNSRCGTGWEFTTDLPAQWSAPRAPREIVADAINALAAFGGDMTSEQALGLLSYWARRRELTSDDVRQVIAHFNARPDAAGGAA